MIDPAAFVHPKAYAGDDVSVGAGTNIWQFASVIRAAKVGARCIIGAGSQIDGGRIGNDCHIQNGASIPHGVEIGDRVFVGPLAIFCNDAWPEWSHDGIDHGVIAAGTTIRVDDEAAIGAGAIILPGVVIGTGAFVAAGAMVNRDVPPGMVWHRSGEIESRPLICERTRLLA